MKVVFNSQTVAYSLKSLKTKIKQSKSPVTNGSVICLLFKNGTQVTYKVVTSLFKGKKNSYTNVRFIK